MKHERKLTTIIESDPAMMQILRAVRTLHLPDWWIGAGFVRNKVWDVLHDIQPANADQRDVDVLYFNPSDVTAKADAAIDATLTKQLPDVKWECINQARTHTWHNHEPYHSSIDALETWVETVTAIAVRLTADDVIEVAAPFGLDDLFAMIVRPTPRASRADFERRYTEKGWLTRWPKLVIRYT